MFGWPLCMRIQLEQPANQPSRFTQSSDSFPAGCSWSSGWCETTKLTQIFPKSQTLSLSELSSPACSYPGCVSVNCGHSLETHSTALRSNRASKVHLFFFLHCCIVIKLSVFRFQRPRGSKLSQFSENVVKWPSPEAMQAAPTGVPDLGASFSQAGCRRSLRAWKKKYGEAAASALWLVWGRYFLLRSVAYTSGVVASSTMICGLRVKSFSSCRGQETFRRADHGRGDGGDY